MYSKWIKTLPPLKTVSWKAEAESKLGQPKEALSKTINIGYSTVGVGLKVEQST